MIFDAKQVPKRVREFRGGASWGTLGDPSHSGTQNVCPKCAPKGPKAAKKGPKATPNRQN